MLGNVRVFGCETINSDLANSELRHDKLRQEQESRYDPDTGSAMGIRARLQLL